MNIHEISHHQWVVALNECVHSVECAWFSILLCRSFQRNGKIYWIFSFPFFFATENLQFKFPFFCCLLLVFFFVRTKHVRVAKSMYVSSRMVKSISRFQNNDFKWINNHRNTSPCFPFKCDFPLIVYPPAKIKTLR